MKFKYRAITKDGITQEGIIEASTENEAIKTLHLRDLTIVSCRSLENIPIYQKEVTIFERITSKDLVVFFRELATLIEGKVVITEALKSLIKQTRKQKLRAVISQIAQEVESGVAFSKAMAKFRYLFPEFYISLIRSAEISGTLERTLVYIADYEEKKYETVSKIKGALQYPLFVIGMTIIVGIVVMIFVIPQLTSILLEAGAELPLATKILIWSSNFLRHFWWILIGGIIAFIVSFIYFYKKNIDFKRFIDKFLLKIPVFGEIIKEFYLERISDNLSTLLKGGITILKSLEVSADVTGNQVFKEILLEAQEQIKAGKSISSVLQTHLEIPPMFVELVRVGETSGSLDEVLAKVSKFYSKEVENVVQNITKLIEPFLVVIIGGGVAIMIMAVLLPIYNLTQAIK